MRQGKKEESVEKMNRQLMSVDFHDFLVKEAIHSDTEIAAEMGITVEEVRALRRKARR